MNYVLLEKATVTVKPHMRTIRGHLERVRGFTREDPRIKREKWGKKIFSEYIDFMKQLEGDEWTVTNIETVIGPMGADIEFFVFPKTLTKEEMTSNRRAAWFFVEFFDKSNEINIHSLFLGKSYQGSGLGSNLMEKAIDFAIGKGVKRATLVANGEVGAYAWAVQGFDWRFNSDLAKKARDHFSEWLDKKYKMDINPNDFKHSWDIATFKIGEEKIGKRWLLGPGSGDWYDAYMDLSANSIGLKIFREYHRLRREKRRVNVQK